MKIAEIKSLMYNRNAFKVVKLDRDLPGTIGPSAPHQGEQGYARAGRLFGNSRGNICAPQSIWHYPFAPGQKTPPSSNSSKLSEG